MKEMARVLEEQARRESPVSDEVLTQEEPPKTKASETAAAGPPSPLPEELEIETVTLEPELCPCPECGRNPERIGEEVTEEIDPVSMPKSTLPKHARSA